MRLLEVLKDRFGALEAAAYSSIKLARYAPEDELAMAPHPLQPIVRPAVPERVN
jgi:hypothetical protein